jgi:hypothetical protein
MKNGKDDSVSFIEEAIRTANLIGFKKTKEILVGLRKVEPSAVFDGTVEIIVNCVALDFNMPKSKIFDKTGENSRLARRLCFALLVHYLNVDKKFLVRYFKRAESTIYNELNLFRELDSSSKFDLAILDRYNRLLNKLDNKIKNQ